MGLFQPVFAALNRHDVRYVVVGGVAVVLHGHARLTADLDLAVDLDPVEATKAIEALVELGLQPSVPVDSMQFADPSVRESWVSDKGMTVFSLRHPDDPLLEVDLFVEPPIPFDELFARSEVVRAGGETIRIAAIEDLIAMKREAGRPVDLEDIAALEEIARDASGD